MELILGSEGKWFPDVNGADIFPQRNAGAKWPKMCLHHDNPIFGPTVGEM